MRLWLAIPGTLGLAAILIVGASMALGDQGGKPPSDSTPPPPPPNAPVSGEQPIWSLGPGPPPAGIDIGSGIRIKGKFVPLPAEATITGITGGASHVSEIRYRNSRVGLDEHGTMTEKYIEPQDEAALAPLLDALSSTSAPAEGQP